MSTITASIVIASPGDVARMHLHDARPVITFGEFSVILSTLSLTAEQRIAWLRRLAADVDDLADRAEALAAATLAEAAS